MGGEMAIECTQCHILLGYRKIGETSRFCRPNRIIQNERFCTKCADDIANKREMGHSGYPHCPKAGKLGKMVEGEKPMQKRIEDYPAVTSYEQETLFTDMLRLGLGSPRKAVEVVTVHAMASRDVDKWLDTLNNEHATPEEQEHARERLHATANEYAWLCREREAINQKIIDANLWTR